MHVDKNDFFRHVSLALCSSLDVCSSLQNCFNYLRQIFPVDRLMFGLHDPESSSIIHIASVDNSGANNNQDIIPLPEDVSREMEKAMNVDRLVPDTSLDPLTAIVAPYVKNQGNSEVIIPLRTENDRLGYLVMQVNKIGAYTAEHLDLMVLVREPLSIAIANAMRHQEIINLKMRLEEDNLQLMRDLSASVETEVVGADAGLKNVMMMVNKVAPLQSTVLLLGETGVGKEVVANALHRLSTRRDGPFIKINCGAIPETLIDSELFGHEKGAFSGAIARKSGRFEQAHGGTIFLDEIGELPPAAQVRLLRVLQNREIERVGGQKSIPVDIRVITATHRNLEQLVAEGNFREDLWFRINAFPINIPPLRHRKEDILLLIQHFLDKKSRELGFRNAPPVAPGAVDMLVEYPWPGNVRELENVIERALIQNRGRMLTLDAFTLSQRPNGPLTALDDSCGCVFPCLAKSSGGNKPPKTQPQSLKLEEVLCQHIEMVLEMADGKVHGANGAAEMLGINASTLRNKMNKLGIAYGKGSHS